MIFHSLDFLKAFDMVDWDFIFSGISFALVSLVAGTHMIKVASNNIQSKIKINGHQGCPFSMFYALLWIKCIQIGDHEIRIVNFSDDTTLLLRDFSCLTKASSSKINFSKSQNLWDVACTNRIYKPRQMSWSQFSIKIVGVHFRNSALDNRNRDKIYDNLTKKTHIWNRMKLSLK